MASGAPTSGATTTLPPSSSTTSSGAVVIDPALREILPETVDGLAVIASPESDADAAADAAVVEYGEAVVTAIAVDPATGEFVYATVVRLRPDVFDDELFRDWRDSFDEGACSQAGGVTGRAEATLGGRTVHIGSCAEGVRTYHVWLEARRALVSASSIGERRLGERLVEGLRE
jgi:hypothetical protein